MQKLIIKNFRQIPYAEIDIAKFTIFIGPQASGKSTIAKLIYFFKSLQTYFSVHTFVSNYIKEEDYYSSFIQSIEKRFSASFPNLNNSDFTIFYTYAAGKNLSISYSSNGIEILLEPDFKRLLKAQLEYYCSEYKNVDFKQNEARKSGDTAFASSIFSAFQNVVNEESERIFEQTRLIKFIPSSRSLLISHPSLFENLNKDTELSLNIDNEILIGFLDISRIASNHFDLFNPFKENKNSRLDIYFANSIEKVIRAKLIKIDNKEYFINGSTKTSVGAASTGQQESVRTLQDIYLSTIEEAPIYRIYEEPEAHLFPEAQKHLIELMALMANKTDSQVVITTHSPYILSIVNNLLYYNKTIERNPNANVAIKKHFGVENLNESENERIYFTKDEVRVYSLGDNASGNYVESIIDPETGLIGANFLDETAEKMYQDFDFMYPLNRKEPVS